MARAARRSRAPRRRPASTRSGSATTCSTGRRPAERGPWDVWTTLAALAASTERVRLGPLVASTAFHPPGLVARMAAAIDEVSGGRFVLGLGTGWNETEFRAFGIPFDDKVSRFEEAFTIIRRLLAGERVTFEGRYPPRRGRRAPAASAAPRAAHGRQRRPARRRHRVAARRLVELLVLVVRQHAGRLRGVERTVRRRLPPQRVRARGDRRRRGRAAVTRKPRRPSSPQRSREHLDALAEAGADEAILVLDPIDERSVAAVAEALGLFAESPRR